MALAEPPRPPDMLLLPEPRELVMLRETVDIKVTVLIAARPATHPLIGWSQEKLAPTPPKFLQAVSIPLPSLGEKPVALEPIWGVNTAALSLLRYQQGTFF